MKPKQPGPKSEQAGAPRAGARPRARRWLFRLGALAAPVLLLLALELGLRLFGYGYPVEFFLKSESGGRAVFIDNPQFARRYFPPGLARSPQPVLFPAVKAPGTIRIFVFGESAAMGDPEPPFGFGRILEVLLREQWPGKKVEVINAAVTAINSHVVREIARDCVDKQGDYWLVYMGNNEVVGPYGAGTIFGEQTPGLGFIRANIALKATRLGQGLEAVKHRWLRRPGPPATWEGMEMFLQQQVAQDDPRMARVYQHFEKNLGDIIQLGHRSGAQVLVATVAGNLKDSPPFASLHRLGLTPTQQAEWDRLYQSGVAQENAADYSAALAAYEKAGQIDDDYAELHFRSGRCHLALKRVEEARKSFAWARDLDPLRFRADTRINRIIRQTVGQHSTAKLLDAVERIAQHSPDGIAGEERFFEHVHFNFSGNDQLARLFAEAILGPNSNQPPLPSAAECALRLAFTGYDRVQIAEEMLKRIQQPPFTTQLDAGAREKRWQQQLDALRSTQTRDALDRTIALYREAVARTPEDWMLRENFARLLQNSGAPTEAEAQWRAVIRLLPHNEQGYYSLANVLDGLGKSAEAVTFFHEALRRRPGSVEARNGLGLALASQGRTAEAVDQFQQSLRTKPDFAEARVNLGQTLAQQGKFDEAMTQYLAALRANSNSVAARINLGKLLANQKKMTEAIAQYEAALRTQPSNAVAHYNLANALTAQGSPEALAHYAAAVSAKPDFAEAHYNLGLGLARQGNNAQALARFAEVVRLNPSFTEARFNLGVALAKERRFTEAVEQFQEVLRLDPGHATAQKFLDQAALKSRGQ